MYGTIYIFNFHTDLMHKYKIYTNVHTIYNSFTTFIQYSYKFNTIIITYNLNIIFIQLGIRQLKYNLDTSSNVFSYSLYVMLHTISYNLHINYIQYVFVCILYCGFICILYVVCLPLRFSF